MIAAWFVVLTLALSGQTGDVLEQAFHGRKVTALLDMPGDDSGVTVRAGQATPVDEQEVSKSLEKHGVSVRKGDLATVTLVKRKGDHIEFQLNGGGFTTKDQLQLPSLDSDRWGETPQERSLLDSMRGTRDPEKRRRFKSRYNSLRAKRVGPLRRELERERRKTSGSRFNVRFASDREAAAVSAEELAAILKPYLQIQ